MKKRLLASLSGAVVLLGGLFSCGGGTESSSGVTIDFWHTSGQGLSEGYAKVATAFQKLVKANDGIDLTINCSYQGDYPTILKKVENSLAAGTAPTMTIAYPDHVAEYIEDEKGVAGKYVVNMETLASDSEVGFGKEAWIGDKGSSDFFSSFYQEGQSYVNEGMYSLPLMKSTEALYYNLELLEPFAFGYNAELKSDDQIKEWMRSLTWDQFVAFLKYIKTNMASMAPGVETPFYYDSDANLFISQCYQKDTPYLSIGTDKKLSCDFDNEAAHNMVQAMKDLKTAGILTTKGVTGTYSSSDFVAGKSIFCVGSTGGSGYQDSEGQFTVGVCEVPYNGKKTYITQGPTLTLIRNPGYTDAVNDLKVKYAWKFIKYLTSTDVNTKLCISYSQGYVPVRSSCYASDAYKAYLAEESIYSTTANVVLNDIGDSYIVTPSIKGTAAAREAVGGIISQVLRGNKTITEAFADAVTTTKLAS